MKRIYKLPLVGKVLNDHPLTGDDNDPIDILDLHSLDVPTFYHPDWQRMVKHSYSTLAISWDIDEGTAMVEIAADEAFHDWLIGILPQLMTIQQEKDWKLDKTTLEKVRLAREG